VHIANKKERVGGMNMQKVSRIDLIGVSSYLIEEDGSFILVDTGGPLTVDKKYIDRRGMLTKALGENGVTGDNLKLIILTHGDSDHSANARFFRDTYACPVAMHTLDEELVYNPTLPVVLQTFQYRSLLMKIIAKLIHNFLIQSTERVLAKFESFQPDLFLKEGDSLKSYGIDAEIWHLPGHTMGSIGIMTREGILIAGDTLMTRKKLVPAWNAVDFKKLDDSNRRIFASSAKMIYTGH